MLNQAKQDSSDERRIFVRFLLSAPVEYKRKNKWRSSKAFVRNISAQGLGIIGDEELKLADTLELSLKLHKEEPISFEGQVVWSQAITPFSYAAGVKFNQVDYSKMTRILNTA